MSGPRDEANETFANPGANSNILKTFAHHMHSRMDLG